MSCGGVSQVLLSAMQCSRMIESTVDEAKFELNRYVNLGSSEPIRYAEVEDRAAPSSLLAGASVTSA